MFNFNPPLDESKICTPFTYYQPFQSSFNPEFSKPTAETFSRSDGQEKWWLQRTGRQITGRAANDDQQGNHSKTPILGRSLPFGPEGDRSFVGESITPFWPEPLSFPETQNVYRSEPVSPSWMSPDYGFVYPSLNQNDAASFQLGASGQATQATPNPSEKKSQQTFRRTGSSRPMICNFCKNNKEVPDIYLNHYLYDPKTQVLACPVLRKHVCQVCGKTGDQAHTLQYCPLNREKGLQAKVPVLLKNRTITNSTGKIRRN